MATQNHNTGPNPSPQASGYETIHADVIAAITEGRNGEGASLSVEQGQAVFRTASLGVLGVLREAGVNSADTLSQRLQAAAKQDKYVDLYDVARRYEQAQMMREEGVDVNAQRDQAHLGRLAEAVAGTAQAIVVASSGSKYVPAIISKGREAIAAYQDPSSDVANVVLGGLIDWAEGTPPEAQQAA